MMFDYMLLKHNIISVIIQITFCFPTNVCALGLLNSDICQFMSIDNFFNFLRCFYTIRILCHLFVQISL